MKATLFGFLITGCLMLLVVCGGPKTPPVPPKAEKVPQELTTHGHTRVDPYFWLNQRENPKVIDYLEAENAYLKASMAHTEKLQKKLYREIVSRIKESDETVPYLWNGYFYYTRFEEGGEYPIYARKKGSLEGEEEILLNVNEMARGHDYYHVTGLAVSEDNRYLSYGVDVVSRRKYTLHVKDLETGDLLEDRIENTTGRAVWANDNQTLFYVSKDSTLRPHMIYRHELGAGVSSDELIHHEKDNTFRTGIFKSKSGQYLFIESSSTLTSEFQYLNADKPQGVFTLFQPRKRGVEYHVAHQENRFLVLTNYKAQNFRLMETPLNRTRITQWKEVIPYRSAVLLESMEVMKDFLILTERENGLRRFRVMSQADDYYIPFGEEPHVIYSGDNAVYDTQTFRFTYTSLTTPETTFDIDLKTRDRVQLKQEEILGDFNAENYESRRVFATARDGVKVPVSLVYRKGMEKNGQNPLLLYAYGSYGYSTEPGFRHYTLSLLDLGFIYAIAHVRGGQEMGRHWYEDGKLLKKRNTFTDFIDCGEYLVQEKYTSPGKLFARGGSAGGLLMGAVVNMKPDLFCGVIAGVPFVDVVTTMLDETIPLTTGEFDEWGNPKIKEYYDYMLSYSPYDNVEAKAYPAMLVTTGLHDSQVQYWEPAKWVAKFRDMKTDNHLLLLHTQMEAGHGGASGRFERYKTKALEYAFILDLAGINK